MHHDNELRDLYEEVKQLRAMLGEAQKTIEELECELSLASEENDESASMYDRIDDLENENEELKKKIKKLEIIQEIEFI